MIKVAILGSTSHVAKGLIYNFANMESIYYLYLFARDYNKAREFVVNNTSLEKYNILTLEEFNTFNYDVIINCIGFGTPAKIQLEFYSILSVTQHFDDLIISYLDGHPNTLYVNFSSGAAYCSDFLIPASEETRSNLNINSLQPQEFYGIAKLHSEIKHRSLINYAIIDLRLFGYFSRFIDLSSQYIITELINCVREKKVFKTNSINITRDFTHPSDLFSLVLKCMNNKKNISYDIYSKAPLSKMELIHFFQDQFDIECVVDDSIAITNTTGIKINYFSEYQKVKELGFVPNYSSIGCIQDQIKYFSYDK